MSINTIKGPLIQPDVNNDNNTTRIMEVDTVYANSITDGIATIENGFISNLVEPISGNQIATKYYVDNSGGGSAAAGPDGSIQYNSSGSFAGSGNLTLTSPNLPNATLNINGVITNGSVTISGSQISGISNPTTLQEAANKNYVDETFNRLGVISLNLVENVSYTYTPTQIYNNILNISSQSNYTGVCVVDNLPTGASMKTFLGSGFILGKTWSTVFRGPQQTNTIFTRFVRGTDADANKIVPISYLFCGFALSTFAVINYSVVTLTCVVTNITPGSEAYTAYVSSNYFDVTTNSRITDRGIYTPSFANSSLVATNGNLIYPILSNPVINSSSPVIYTYANLSSMLIIRTGLTGPTNDTFVSATTLVSNSGFLMGGGTFKFWIQNPSGFNLTLLPGTDWTFQSGNNQVIPSGYCGAFFVAVTVSPPSCIIYSVGTNPING